MYTKKNQEALLKGQRKGNGQLDIKKKIDTIKIKNDSLYFKNMRLSPFSIDKIIKVIILVMLCYPMLSLISWTLYEWWR